MEKNNLLILSNHYLTFVKDQVEALSASFDNVTALVRFNPARKLFGYRSIIDVAHTFPNIHVFTTRVLYLPLDRQYKSLGERHYHAIDKAIRYNHLNFDLIHAHFTWSAGYAGARLKEEYGIPFVVTGHGYDIYSLPFKDDEWRERIEYVLNTADHIITVSQSNLECIKKLDVSTSVTVIPNGFKGDLFYPRDPSECKKTLNLPQNKKIILTVGNLEPVKGQAHLVEAVRKILQERKDILCVIIGAGKLRTALDRQIRSLGLEDYIVLAGGKPHSEIPLWMNACDLFVLPSLNEGNPTVMFEALGCGKPFVGTKVGGVPEVIASDDYGLLVKPADPEYLAEKILAALDREWDREAILRYAERFTWENIAKETMQVYTRILSNFNVKEILK